MQARLVGGDAKLIILFRGQVDHDQPVDPGGLRVFEECGDAVGVDRVVVAHEDDGRLVVFLAEFGRHGEDAFQRLPGVERAEARLLDRWAVGHRVGEGEAQFDDVDAGGGEAAHDLKARLRRGVAGHDVGDEGGFARLRKVVEAICQSRHRSSAVCAAPLRFERALARQSSLRKYFLSRGFPSQPVLPRGLPPSRSSRSPRPPRSSRSPPR